MARKSNQNLPARAKMLQNPKQAFPYRQQRVEQF